MCALHRTALGMWAKLTKPQHKKTNMKNIKDFQVIDHGIEHAQFFQGCGVALTNYEHCVTGCGESAADAFNDALDCIGQDDFNVETIQVSDDGKLFTSEKAEKNSVTTYLEKQGLEPQDDCELYYYVSIRWNGAEEGKHFGLFDGLRGLELEMTLEQARSASHQGSCDDDVEALAKVPEIAAQLDKMDVDTIRAGLKESGAWDAEELADDEQNRRRAVWLAACDIRENYNKQKD